ncbi:MAG: ATP-binding protein [Deltaproteobacteria bacterium]
MILSSIPIFLVDVIGSIMMIVLSLLSLRLVFKLRRQDRNNLVWTYLWWACVALSCFAVSRSAGHILKNFLLMAGQKSSWEVVRPFSGAINSVMFIVVGSVTLFFERIWNIYQLVLKDRQALRLAHRELLFLNQNLEGLVEKRTKALSASEYKYRKIFEVSKDMILVTTKDGTIVNLNPSGYHLLGMDMQNDQIEDRNIQKFLTEAEAWPRIIASVEKEGAVDNVELEVVTADGTHKRIILGGSVDDETGSDEDIIHFLVKDIQKRKAMEEQLAQADKLASIGELSSGVAHEINNPLGVILGYTQLLLRGEPNDSERYADLKTIEKHVRNCKTIVEDLLSFSRKSETEKKMIDIHRIINDVIAFVQHHSNIEHIAIKKDFSPSVKQLLFDEKKIKQVLINLLMNAIHAVGNKGNIGISTELNGSKGNLIIKVIDDGHGIEPGHLKKIFDPFFTTKPTGEGTGHGLSVSYGIIQNHGGRIHVESESGEGTVFSVVLPTALSPQED